MNWKAKEEELNGSYGIIFKAPTLSNARFIRHTRLGAEESNLTDCAKFKSESDAQYGLFKVHADPSNNFDQSQLEVIKLSDFCAAMQVFS